MKTKLGRPPKRGPKHKTLCISVPENVAKIIDDERGDLYRSEYVSKIIMAHHLQK
jgi:hypothetical protein